MLAIILARGGGGELTSFFAHRVESLVHAANFNAAADGYSVGGGVDGDSGEWGNVNHDGVAYVIERNAPAVEAAANKQAMVVLFRVCNLARWSVSKHGRGVGGPRTMSGTSASVPTRTTAAMPGVKTLMLRCVKFAKRGALGSTINAAGERSGARPATSGSSVRLRRRNRTERPPTTAASRRSGV